MAFGLIRVTAPTEEGVAVGRSYPAGSARRPLTPDLQAGIASREKVPLGTS